MQDHATDPDVYIRSMASRGHLGGLAWATPQALRVLDAAGCDVILIETVGVGQSEVEVAGLADTTLVLLAPGMGDGIQAAKAGILEVGDVYVVNKADRDGADQVVRDLRSVLPRIRRRRLAAADREDGRPDRLRASTTCSTPIERHREHLRDSGLLDRRRRRRARDEIEAIAVTALRGAFGDLHGHADLERLAAQVVPGDPRPLRGRRHAPRRPRRHPLTAPHGQRRRICRPCPVTGSSTAASSRRRSQRCAAGHDVIAIPAAVLRRAHARGWLPGGRARATDTGRREGRDTAGAASTASRGARWSIGS